MKTDYPLKDLTTFKIGGAAQYFLKIRSLDMLFQALEVSRNQELPVSILGGGSNVLISDRGVDGLVLSIRTKGIETIAENARHITLNIAVGECWDDVVALAVRHGWWGIENLSAIPGTVGAVPIQNVGAYGQEASNVIDSVEVCDLLTGERTRIAKEECCFGYRASIFNGAMKSRYIILSTVITLKKQGIPNLSYHDLQEYFNHVPQPSLSQIREAIIAIRRRKLPDPEQIGNAGSFFENIVLQPAEFERLEARMAQNFSAEVLSRLVVFRQKCSDAARIKIPTAFLLDVCGLKGMRVGGAALYEKHPLIVVNATGRATAHDVLGLMQRVRQAIFQKTGLEIVPEPNLIGFTEEELQAYFRLD